MVRFLFSTVPVPGHLDQGGLLETARLLLRRGHEVLWASGAQVAAHLERAGVPLAIIPVAFPMLHHRFNISVQEEIFSAYLLGKILQQHELFSVQASAR